MDNKELTNNRDVSSNMMVTFAAFVIVVAGLKVAAPILAEFLLALFIAVVCIPPIKWLVTKKIPQGFAIAMVLVSVLLFLEIGRASCREGVLRLV